MKNRKIILLIIALAMSISHCIAFAETSPESDEIPEGISVLTADEDKEPEKNIILEERFETGISQWNRSDNRFYIVDRKLVLNNLNKPEESRIISKAMSVDNDELEFDLNIKKGEYFDVMFRMVDDKSFYCLRFYGGSSRIMILKKVKGGSYATVAKKSFNIAYDTNYRVGLSMIGDVIGVRINGTDVLTATDSSLKAGSIGFLGKNTEAIVDNIEIFRYSDVTYQFEDAEKDDKNPKKIIYVSPNGSDASGDGTEEKPYATIEGAKVAVNKIKDGTAPIDVVFMGGEYPVSQTIAFSAKDSGTADAPIRYVAKEGEKVVFTGAKRLDVTKSQPVNSEMKERLYENAKKNVIQFDLKEQGISEKLADFTKPAEEQEWIGVTLKPPVITLNKMQQTLARWPNSGYNNVQSCETGGILSRGGLKSNGGTIYYSEANPSRWVNAERLYIEGFLGNFWLGEWARVDSVDPSKNAINMKYATQWGIVEKHRWSAVNLIEELDIPGEWYIDPDNMLLYYYPPYELTEKDSLEIAVLNRNMFNISGAENLTFEGIEFTMTSGDSSVSFDNTVGGNGINIDNGSKNILIKDCVISHIGMNGIIISSTDVTVDGCVIYDTGFDAIDCRSCGDRNTLTPSNVTICNCDISDVCRDTNSNNFAAVFMKANTVDVVVKNNLIHNCENSVIRYGGNGHSIAYNEFYNSVIQTADAGAIYAGRSWADYGTVVEYNFIHDIGQKTNAGDYPASSIFWDDYHSGNDFSHNISVVNNYVKTSTVKIGGGIDNIVKGNTMVSSANDIIAEDRSTGSIRDWPQYAADTLKLSTIPYTSAEFTAKYPKIGTLLTRIEENDGQLRLENTITDNLTVDCEPKNLPKTILEASEYERNTNISSDYSIFVDPTNLDYRVKKEAKEKYGISDEIIDESFDLDTIGIRNGYKPDRSKLEVIATYPQNGTKGIETKDVILAWSKAPIADTYRYVVATDPDFTNIVAEDITEYRSVKLDGIKNDTTYYWRVYSRQDSRQYKCEVENTNGIMSFTTSQYDTLDKSVFFDRLERLYALSSEIKEGDKVGEYKRGTIAEINAKIATAEAYADLDSGAQSDIDNVAFELSKFINGIDYYKNIGYTTLGLKAASKWYPINSNNVITSGNGTVKMDLISGGEITLCETLSNYNVMCFKTRIASMEESWVAYGLRASDMYQNIWGQDCYYILIKPDIFELQKHGKIYATAPNNGKFAAGKWYDVQFGAITTPNGVNMYFKLDDEVIFDYLDKSEPNYKQGMFAMYASTKNNVVELADADNLPDSLYVMSDRIIREINAKEEDGKTLNTDDSGYVETGTWKTSNTIKADAGDKVRTSTVPESSAKWIMESGAAGNGKLYKLYYYHLPEAEGDKNVKVYISGYGGDYETTIDLSSGTAGYVELGTFTFIDADYIGRLSVTFTGSGEGKLNVGNVKYELVDEGQYTNMLKQ